MRIAIYHNLPSGGAKRTLAEAAKRLSPHHHVDVYTLSCSDHNFSDLRPYVRTHKTLPFDPLPLLRSPFGRLNQVVRCADLVRLSGITKEIAKTIDQGGYDVVFVHPCQFEQSPSVLRYLERTPSVYYCQEPRRVLYEKMPARPYDDDAIRRRKFLNQLDPLPSVYRGMLKRAERINTRSATTVLVNSQFMQGNLREIFGVNAKVSYHGVDVDHFRPVPMEKRDFVLSVGSLTPLKGFDFLVRAMAEYPVDERPPLVVASNFQNPPERAYLEQLAAQLGVELRLLGNITDDDLVQYYNQAKVVAYAPVREPFGLVPLEAMACATPAVVVREGGVAESVINGQTGFSVDRDPAQFAAALRQVVNNPSLARQLGDNGRKHILKTWTWERAIDTVETHLSVEAGGVKPVLETSTA